MFHQFLALIKTPGVHVIMVVPSAPQLYLAASKILEEKCILIYGGDNTKIHKDSFGDKKYNYKALSVQKSIAVRLLEGTSFP